MKDIDVVISIGCIAKPQKNGVKYFKFGVRDSAESDLTPLFADITDIIQQHIELGRSILVHCQGGINRSPMFVLAYLCRYCTMSIDEGMQYIKERRPSVRFQPHYVFQLQSWLLTLEI